MGEREGGGGGSAPQNESIPSPNSAVWSLNLKLNLLSKTCTIFLPALSLLPFRDDSFTN